MASLSFNSTRITNPTTQSCKPNRLSRPTTTTFPSHALSIKNPFKRPTLASNSVFESPQPVSAPPEDDDEEEDEDEDDPTAELCFFDPGADPEVVKEWEMDFCSRPILDARGKKVWELVVCDKSLSLQYTKYFPNNIINSVTLREAIVSIVDALGVPLPEKIRFFRSQMQTIITRACTELSIQPVPSKRCVSLLLWLEERYETVYTRHPGFQKGSKPLMALDNPFPMELPENLVGEKWAFVQLPYTAVQEEISSLESRYAFGGNLDLDLLGLEIDDDTLVPGLAVASSRAKPLAAWMNGLEVCSMEVDVSRACLILSVGVSTRYVYATYKKNAMTTREAEAWEAAKKACGGLHFLAIQENLDSDDCVGFWLLLDLPPPSV
ncbi:hypothetical protein QJS04_geneDACA015601 [Acorus gramineus]|uniref:Protein TAB2 homolog, chloroplastic n=1 Tax=Acorus gramineus TaxID=55184 RepID=A0AAV9AV05_ACOGR|nr:hypothetical protein QJS04_geneDACA015601 [Acorus gramineus]